VPASLLFFGRQKKNQITKLLRIVLQLLDLPILTSANSVGNRNNRIKEKEDKYN
jgi:hypothetical protein